MSCFCLHWFTLPGLIVIPPDSLVQPQLVKGVPPEPELLREMLKWITPGSLVVDVGAGFGVYSLFFAKATGPAGKVFAFEPQRTSFNVRRRKPFELCACCMRHVM